jgi:hypothetical protein
MNCETPTIDQIFKRESHTVCAVIFFNGKAHGYRVKLSHATKEYHRRIQEGEPAPALPFGHEAAGHEAAGLNVRGRLAVKMNHRRRVKLVMT